MFNEDIMTDNRSTIHGSDSIHNLSVSDARKFVPNTSDESQDQQRINTSIREHKNDVSNGINSSVCNEVMGVPQSFILKTDNLIHRNALCLKTDTLLGRRGFQCTIFAETIKEWVEQYEKAKPHERRVIATRCMEDMKQKGCRFLTPITSGHDDCTTVSSHSDLVSLYTPEFDSDKVVEKIIRSFRYKRSQDNQTYVGIDQQIGKGSDHQCEDQNLTDNENTTTKKKNDSDRGKVSYPSTKLGAFLPYREENLSLVTLQRKHSLYCPGDENNINEGDNDINDITYSGRDSTVIWGSSLFWDENHNAIGRSGENLGEYTNSKKFPTEYDDGVNQGNGSRRKTPAVSPQPLDAFERQPVINGVCHSNEHDSEYPVKEQTRTSESHFRKVLDCDKVACSPSMRQRYVEYEAEADYIDDKNTNCVMRVPRSIDNKSRSFTTYGNYLSNENRQSPFDSSLQAQHVTPHSFESDQFHAADGTYRNEDNQYPPVSIVTECLIPRKFPHRVVTKVSDSKDISLEEDCIYNDREISHYVADGVARVQDPYSTLRANDFAISTLESQSLPVIMKPPTKRSRSSCAKNSTKDEKMRALRLGLRIGCDGSGEVPAIRHQTTINELSARLTQVEGKADKLHRYNQTLLSHILFLESKMLDSTDLPTQSNPGTPRERKSKVVSKKKTQKKGKKVKPPRKVSVTKKKLQKQEKKVKISTRSTSFKSDEYDNNSKSNPDSPTFLENATTFDDRATRKRPHIFDENQHHSNLSNEQGIISTKCEASPCLPHMEPLFSTDLEKSEAIDDDLIPIQLWEI